MPFGSVLRRPFNWNPICVEISSIDVQQSHVHSVWRSATPQKRRQVARQYMAQINLGGARQGRKVRTERGDRDSTQGWLVLRTLDLVPETTLIMPVKGDMITKIYAGTGLEKIVDYVIEEVRFESPLKGRPLLIYVDFERNRERSHDFTASP